MRSIIAILTAAIVGVVTLDATAIVAAPPTPKAASAPATKGSLGDPLLRLLRWDGYVWLVYPSDQTGPEPGVRMTDSERAVHVDSKGRLHLRIVKENGVWRGAELRLLSPISYGRFRMVVDSAVGKFDKNTVLGMFVYRPGSKKHTNEIDIEDSQFTHFLGPKHNAQYVVQPYYAHIPGRPQWYKFHIGPNIPSVLQQFSWSPGQAHFLTRTGTSSRSPLFNKHTYKGSLVPTASNVFLYLNLWLSKNHPPTHGTHSVILKSFSYVPGG